MSCFQRHQLASRNAQAQKIITIAHKKRPGKCAKVSIKRKKNMRAVKESIVKTSASYQKHRSHMLL